ncbi:MAG: helix-turn-helix transcriptional regulator [bacterium]|nr:helix-turn-helix transcriptional regulator [bacterium]
MSVKEYIEKLKREDKKFAREYERTDLAFEVSESVFEARVNAGLSQTALAKKVGTKQSSIARIESGVTLPSSSFLEKIAKALKMQLKISFVSPQSQTSAKNSERDVSDAAEHSLIMSPYYDRVEIRPTQTPENISSGNNNKDINI